MERLLACGPLGERIAKDPAHMAAYVKFVESNKGLKKADFNVKFVKELAPSLSAEVQVSTKRTNVIPRLQTLRRC